MLQTPGSELLCTPVSARTAIELRPPKEIMVMLAVLLVGRVPYMRMMSCIVNKQALRPRSARQTLLLILHVYNIKKIECSHPEQDRL